MLGWILYDDSAVVVKSESYEINRLVEVGNKQGVTIRCMAPSDFDLVVDRSDRTSILVGGEDTELPDFFLPRMGAGTDYWSLRATYPHQKPCSSATFEKSIWWKNISVSLLSLSY